MRGLAGGGRVIGGIRRCPGGVMAGWAVDADESVRGVCVGESRDRKGATWSQGAGVTYRGPICYCGERYQMGCSRAMRQEQMSLMSGEV